MKMQTIAFVGLFSLCFLFPAFTARPLFTITGKSDGGELEPVLDTDGEELSTDKAYFLSLPLAGGLSMAYTGSCPYDVVREPEPWQIGLPLKFTPVANASGEVIYESTDLYIKFTHTPCSGYSVWGFRFDAWARGSLLSTGGTEATFRLIKVEGTLYKIDSCPSSCESLGVTYANMLRLPLLKLGGETLHVQFVKAYD